MNQFTSIYPADEPIEENNVSTTASMVQLTSLQYNQLCNDVKNGVMGNKSFIGCALKYRGNEDREETEEFIKCIDIHKKIVNMSDKDALISFPVLLVRSASIWWQGVSAGVETWTDAIKALRCAFAPELRPYEIYMKLFSTPQEEFEPINKFLDHKRALLAQLPPNLYDENQELDLIYGLLILKLRKKIMRADISSFHSLMERARHFESIEVEKRTQE